MIDHRLSGLFLTFILILNLVACNKVSPKPVEFEFVKLPGYGPYSTMKGYAALKITRDGKSYDLTLNDSKADIPYGHAEVITMQDLDKDNEIEIAINLLSCGAYCLTNFIVVYFDPTSGQYGRTKPFTRKISEVDDIHISENHTTEFFTRNEDSIGTPTGMKFVAPIQILRYQNHQLLDVSAEYPELLHEDANFWLAHITKEEIQLSETFAEATGITHFKSGTQDDPEAERQLIYFYFASYLADMCSVEKCEEGWQTYHKLCVEEYCAQYVESIQKALDKLLHHTP